MYTKYHRLAQLLKNDIAQMKKDGSKKLPSEDSIAQTYGVSRETVRQALRILTEEGLIEKRKGSGSFLAESAPDAPVRCAVVLSYPDEYIFPALIHDIKKRMTDSGYAVSVYATENSVQRQREILTELMNADIAGVIAEGCKTALPNPNIDLITHLHRAGLPIVFLYGAEAGLEAYVRVGDDNYAGGYQLACHLLKTGHKTISGIFKSDDMQGLQRYYGCISAMRDYERIPPDSNFSWYDTEARIQILNGDTAFFRRFLQTGFADSSAVICYNDEIAYKLIKFLAASGVRVPEDVAVVSFDNSYYCTLSHPYITSLGHMEHMAANKAADCLTALMRGDPCDSVDLPWELYERESG